MAPERLRLGERSSGMPVEGQNERLSFTLRNSIFRSTKDTVLPCKRLSFAKRILANCRMSIFLESAFIYCIFAVHLRDAVQRGDCCKAGRSRTEEVNNTLKPRVQRKEEQNEEELEGDRKDCHCGAHGVVRRSWWSSRIRRTTLTPRKIPSHHRLGIIDIKKGSPP